MKIKTDIAHDLQILKNVISLLPNTYRNRNINRVIVRDILLQGTDHSGSTSCYNKCLELKIEPDGYRLPTFSEIQDLVHNETNE